MQSESAKKGSKAFTLIELLIVVAIIAILAAIAVPNFLEAQVRAKVSREKNDLRTQATGMEAYFIDNNQYTRDSDSALDTMGQISGKEYFEYANGIVQLTTPIAYLNTILTDPFAPKPKGVGQANNGAIGYRIASGSWSYGSAGFNDNQNSYEAFAALGARSAYCLIGVGPDGARCRIGYKCFPFMGLVADKEGPSGANLSDNIGTYHQPGIYTDYDPTNGTTSLGDVYRMGGDWRSGRFCYNGETIGSETSYGNGTW